MTTTTMNPRIAAAKAYLESDELLDYVNRQAPSYVEWFDDWYGRIESRGWDSISPLEWVFIAEVSYDCELDRDPMDYDPVGPECYPF